MAQARNGSNEKLLVRTGQAVLNQTIHNKSYIINKIWETIFCGYVQLDTIQEYSFSFFRSREATIHSMLEGRRGPPALLTVYQSRIQKQFELFLWTGYLLTARSKLT